MTKTSKSIYIWVVLHELRDVFPTCNASARTCACSDISYDCNPLEVFHAVHPTLDVYSNRMEWLPWLQTIGRDYMQLCGKTRLIE